MQHAYICRELVQQYYAQTQIHPFLRSELKVDTRVVDRGSCRMIRDDGQYERVGNRAKEYVLSGYDRRTRVKVVYLLGPLDGFYPNISPIIIYWEAKVLHWRFIPALRYALIA